MLKPSPSVKTYLHEQCLAYINACIHNAQFAMEDARQSGNNETKSSAGDKHETGRALLQLEQEKNTKQLAEMTQLRERLLKINPLITSGVIVTGSAVVTNLGNFYIAVAAGKIEAQGNFYFAISPSSPIAIKLLGLKEEDSILFNRQTYQIRYIL